MAKISKRIIAVVLMVAMLTTLLSGCSNDQKEVSPVPDNTQQVTPTENVTDVVTPTAAVIETGYKVYGHDADLIISEDWHDYIGRLDVFVYGLISEDFGIDFDVFPAGIVLPDGREVCGIAYTDYTECYTDETETKNYVATGFISAIGEDGITQEEMDSGLIIDDLENPDCSFDLLYEYRSAPYKDHCVVYGQYLTYGVDENGCIFYENEPYQKEKCDESLGALYSYDEGRYLFNPNVGDFVPLTGETLSEVIDYAELEKEINEILETQDVNFAQVDVDSCFSIAQEAVAAYLLSMQEETFLGYDVASLVEIAKDLKKDECIRITEEGAMIIKVEPWSREASQLMKWVVGSSAVAVIILSAVLMSSEKLLKAHPQMSIGLGVLSAVAIDLLMQVVIENKDIRDLDWRSVAVAAVEGAISGALYLKTRKLDGWKYYVFDTAIDGVIGGADRFIRAKLDGKEWSEAGEAFVNGFVLAASISAGFKLLTGAISKIASIRRARAEKTARETKIAKQRKASPNVKNVDAASEVNTQYGERVAQKAMKEAQVENSWNQLPADAKYCNTDGIEVGKKGIERIAKTAKDGEIIGKVTVDKKTRDIIIQNHTVTVDLEKDAIAKVSIAGMGSSRDSNFRKACKALIKEFKDDRRKIPKVIKNALERNDIDIEDISPDDMLKTIKQCGYVFHECADLETILLVPIEIHKAFRHAGGVSAAKALEMRTGIEAVTNIGDLLPLAG